MHVGVPQAIILFFVGLRLFNGFYKPQPELKADQLAVFHAGVIIISAGSVAVLAWGGFFK